MTTGVEKVTDLDKSGVGAAEETLRPDDVRALIHEGLAVAKSGEIDWDQQLKYSHAFGSETLIVIGPKKEGELSGTPRIVRNLTRFQVNSTTQPPVRISTGVTTEFGNDGAPFGNWQPATLDRGREVIAGLRSKPTPPSR